MKKLWTTEEALAIGHWHAECDRLESEHAAMYAGTGAAWDGYEREYGKAEAMLTRSLRPVLRRIDRATDTIAEYEQIESELWAGIDANK